MNTTTKQGAAAGVSVLAVAVIVLGTWGVSSSMTTPEPTPTVSATPTSLIADNLLEGDVPALNARTVERDAWAEAKKEAERIEAERVAAVAAEAARLAAEQAEAERLALEQAQQNNDNANDGQSNEQGGGEVIVEEVAPPVRCPGGSTADSSDGYNDTRCVPLTASNGQSCFEGTNYLDPACTPFRP